MSTPAIRFDRISKRYRLRRGWYRSIRDEVASVAKRLVRRDSPDNYFWALQDVSFDIAVGDVVGLIGPNGAGKSTILKILSRVTVPTRGTFTTAGRVGALIEIGAGFHPDLTGRENVYLNGSVLGMRRREIDAKFDRIVAFAEVEKFIDQPIKYYSSGMQVRLGFSVAAHIDPDILLVDEVLAVGDASFQTKCLNKLAELKEQGKTIVLVSHNMASIVQHSKKVLWIEAGALRGYGAPDDISEQYLRAIRERTPAATSSQGLGDDDPPLRIGTITLCDRQGQPRSVFQHGEAACIDVAFTVVRPVPDPVFEVTFQDSHGYALGGITSRLQRMKLDTSRRSGTIRLILDPVLFLKGGYAINVHIRDHAIERYYDARKHAADLIVDGPSVASREVSGHLVYPHEWELR